MGGSRAQLGRLRHRPPRAQHRAVDLRPEQGARSLVLFALGCAGILYARPPIALGLHQPIAAVPAIAAADFYRSFYRAALPQLPVTLLNAIVSTAKLTEDLYGPKKAVSVRKISLSIAAMDLSSCFFGHFLVPHGGGLAGQHKFGARTGSSMAFGVLKMGLAILGPSLLRALEAFPSAVLGAFRRERRRARNGLPRHAAKGRNRRDAHRRGVRPQAGDGHRLPAAAAASVAFGRSRGE